MSTPLGDNSWEQRSIQAVLPAFSDSVTLKSQGPLVLDHGEGIYVVDVHGKRYLDANSGLWNSVAGFNHPVLIEAGCRQFRRFPSYHSFFGRMSDVTIELCERLIAISPFESGRVFLTNSGSEANDTAVKMLWLLATHQNQPQRRKILTRINAYHGVTVAAASMTAKPYNTAFGLPLSDFIHVDCPHYWRYGTPDESEEAYSQRLAERLERVILAEDPSTIAGFFAEPVLGAGGVIPPPTGYFPAIQQVLRRYNIPLIADEVICGLGRTGVLWGSKRFDLEPDIIVASKCITAGYFPMGAVIVKAAVADALDAAIDEQEEFAHGFTSAGHPVGCAIALSAIDLIMTGGLLQNIQALSGQFEAGLAAFASNPHVGEVRTAGWMGALEIVADKETGEPFPAKFRVSEKIANTALDLGLICRPLGQAIVICPPFIMTAEEMHKMFSMLTDTLERVLHPLGELTSG